MKRKREAANIEKLKRIKQKKSTESINHKDNLSKLEKLNNVKQYNKKYDEQSNITTHIGKITKCITYHAFKKLEQLIEKREISSDVINQRIVVRSVDDNITLERIDYATLGDQLATKLQNQKQPVEYWLEYITITPLHLAVKEGAVKMVELLIENGADINAKAQQWFRIHLYYKQNDKFDFTTSTLNEFTFTALDIAYEKKNYEIINLLDKNFSGTADSKEDQAMYDADTEEDIDQIPENSDNQLEEKIPPAGESADASNDY